MKLTDEQIERYGRQLVLDEVGDGGQKRLLSAKVLIVGLGGLGSPVTLYLAAAGVGHLGLVDDEKVELSNLQRQVIHATADIGRLKVDSAEEKIRRLNPEVRVDRKPVRMTAKNALSLLSGYQVVVDGSDNLKTKFLLNDAAVLAGVPLVCGGVLRGEGQAMTVVPGKSACYRCLFLDPPPPGEVPTCREVGVLGVVPGIIGGVQAAEVLKLLLGAGGLLTDRLLVWETFTMEHRLVRLHRNPHCPVCGEAPTITKLT